jgi:hypothetical protein
MRPPRVACLFKRPYLAGRQLNFLLLKDATVKFYYESIPAINCTLTGIKKATLSKPRPSFLGAFKPYPRP